MKNRNPADGKGAGMRSRRQFLGFLVLLAAIFNFSGCSTQTTAPTEQEAQESLSVISQPAQEITDVEPDHVSGSSSAITTVDNSSYGPGGAGIVYRKVPARKVMDPGKVFNVYTEAKAADNHFSPSGWMGDFGDLKINDRFSTNPHTGASCIQIVYSNRASQGARWAGIYWQNPANNWGSRPGGYDLTGATKLTFWARGEKGGERIEDFKIGGITGEFGDSDVVGSGPVVLTPEWQKFSIDLSGKDLSSISGGFCWATNLDANPDGAIFYLDDIRYE